MKDAFDPRGREKYVAKMNKVGYVEVEVFTPHSNGYCCQSCPAMTFDKDSPTGFFCRLVGFPDDPKGCCDLWYPLPEVARVQSRLHS
jgi:hypothetical protein